MIKNISNICRTKMVDIFENQFFCKDQITFVYAKVMSQSGMVFIMFFCNKDVVFFTMAVCQKVHLLFLVVRFRKISKPLCWGCYRRLWMTPSTEKNTEKNEQKLKTRFSSLLIGNGRGLYTAFRAHDCQNQTSYDWALRRLFGEIRNTICIQWIACFLDYNSIEILREIKKFDIFGAGGLNLSELYRNDRSNFQK